MMMRMSLVLLSMFILSAVAHAGVHKEANQIYTPPKAKIKNKKPEKRDTRLGRDR